MNFAEAEPSDFLQALVTQWRIGDREAFLENVLRNLKFISALSISDSLQVLGWAYQEAVIGKRDKDIDTLRAALANSDHGPEKLSSLRADIEVSRIEKNLSPMGIMALRSANWDLLNAEKDARSWRDAGMISLGFFRILELEFNYKVLMPAVKTVDFEAFEKILNSLQATRTAKQHEKQLIFGRK